MEPVELLWISNKCFRVKQTNKSETFENRGNTLSKFGYIESNLYDSDEDCDEMDVMMTENGLFKCTMDIASVFFAQIIGSRGLTKKRLEAETKSQIIIPKIGTKGNLEIIGPTKIAIVSARNKINLIVLSARSKYKSTHFLSIPFNSVSIQKSFEKFKEEVLKNNENSNIESNLFTKLNKLHLTLGMLTLIDENDRTLAAQILNECKLSIIEKYFDANKSSEIHLCGLEIMNDDPSSVNVLYGVVESNDLKIIANDIMRKFKKMGLAQEKSNNIKPHVTLMNSKHFNQQNESSKYQNTFDATKIIKNYSTFDFGYQKLNEIHISQRHSTALNGFYETSSKILF